MNENTELKKAKLTSSKIKPHFPLSLEGQLMWSVVDMALVDASRICRTGEEERHKRSAIEYLRNDMPHCELAGVSSEWVRRIIKKVGLSI